MAVQKSQLDLKISPTQGTKSQHTRGGRKSAIVNGGWVRYEGYLVVVVPDTKYYECLSVAQQGSTKQSNLYQKAIGHSVLPLRRFVYCKEHNVMPMESFDFGRYGAIYDDLVCVTVDNPIDGVLEVLQCWLVHLLPVLGDENVEKGSSLFDDDDVVVRCVALYGPLMMARCAEKAVDVVVILGGQENKHPFLISCRWYVRRDNRMGTL